MLQHAVSPIAGTSHFLGLKLTDREGSFWLGADRSTLYIAMLSEVAPDGTLLSRAVPDGDRDIVAALHALRYPIYRNDCLVAVASSGSMPRR